MILLNLGRSQSSQQCKMDPNQQSRLAKAKVSTVPTFLLFNQQIQCNNRPTIQIASGLFILSSMETYKNLKLDRVVQNKCRTSRSSAEQVFSKKYWNKRKKFYDNTFSDPYSKRTRKEYNNTW